MRLADTQSVNFFFLSLSLFSGRYISLCHEPKLNATTHPLIIDLSVKSSGMNWYWEYESIYKRDAYKTCWDIYVWYINENGYKWCDIKKLYVYTMLTIYCSIVSSILSIEILSKYFISNIPEQLNHPLIYNKTPAKIVKAFT